MNDCRMSEEEYGLKWFKLTWVCMHPVAEWFCEYSDDLCQAGEYQGVKYWSIY